MANVYLQNNVFEEALDRIRFIYDNHEEVIVSMSGGKDSTVLFELTRIVAKEKGRLPIKVFWLDQEAEWQGTVDYMKRIMYDEDVEPYWFQIPFDFQNSLSTKADYIRIWDKDKLDLLIHPFDEISIKENPLKKQRFGELVSELPNTIAETNNCAVLVGMRIEESLNRRMTIAHGNARYKGITWAQKKRDKIQVFWPIYDWTFSDVWVGIGKYNWDYNVIYDKMYKYGVNQHGMRISALIHETSWHAIELLQEFENATYNRFIRRVDGVSTFRHLFDQMDDLMNYRLPFMFKNWLEYRDYLLEKITQPKHWDLFKNRWKNQHGDEWYKIHVKELLVNDFDGTINSNARARIRKEQKKGSEDGVNKYYERQLKQFNKVKRNKKRNG